MTKRRDGCHPELMLLLIRVDVVLVGAAAAAAAAPVGPGEAVAVHRTLAVAADAAAESLSHLFSSIVVGSREFSSQAG